jgi:outer membrane protein TolC
MVAAGRSAPVDLLREQAEQADASEALMAAKNQAEIAAANLKATIGIAQTSEISLSDSLDSLAMGDYASPTLADAVSAADSRRPELSAAELQVAAARDSMAGAKAEYAPQVYGLAMADASDSDSGAHAGFTVGLAATVGIADGGQRKSDIDAARARLSRARADESAMREAIDQQVTVAWLSLQTAQAEVAEAKIGIAAATEGFRLADLRYNAGKSTIAERVDALYALTRAKGSLDQAKAGLIIARAQLAATAGDSD